MGNVGAMATQQKLTNGETLTEELKLMEAYQRELIQAAKRDEIVGYEGKRHVFREYWFAGESCKRKHWKQRCS